MTPTALWEKFEPLLKKQIVRGVADWYLAQIEGSDS